MTVRGRMRCSQGRRLGRSRGTGAASGQLSEGIPGLRSGLTGRVGMIEDARRRLGTIGGDGGGRRRAVGSRRAAG